MGADARQAINEYVATFHTHLSAMKTQRALATTGVSARLAPVPRQVSASCGVCVFYESETPQTALLDADFERLFRICDGAYELLAENR